MRAVDEIEAAIARLTELRDDATDGEWKSDPDGEVYQHGFSADGGRVTYLRAHATCGRTEDAALIVTLHRTIDAQLAILLGAVEAWRAVEKEGSPDFLVRHVEGYMHDRELALARAINGTAS